MLSGRRAFQEERAILTMMAILHKEARPLRELAPHLAPEWDGIVSRAMAKAPADRYQNMAELRVELERMAEQRAVTPGGEAPVMAASRTTVGRDAQRGQLWRAYARVKEGRGLILAVSGEAGIGKTSLLEEFLAELGQRGERPVLARGRCSERLAGAEAYLPILEALDSLLHGHTAAPAAGTMKTLAPTWYGLVAGDAAETSTGVAAREAGPAASQERMKRELGALCQELSRKQPLILVIDDLHWADVSTIDMLNYLAGRFADMRLLALVSYRPSDMALARHPFLAIRGELQSHGLFEEIGLRFLEPQDVERYLALQFPGNEFPGDFAATIHAKTEGSPLFMADLVRYLRDTGGIVEESGRWALARSLPEGPKDLPESVRGMIQRKIGLVEERDRKLLVAASVQGHEFDSAVVAEAVEMDAGDVEESLETLERVHVLVKRGEEREFPDRSLTLNYQFVHVLYQNLLYASLQPTRRAAISGRAARALVAHHGDQAAGVAARVAMLYEAARDFAASARYFCMAANRSAGLFAFGEALSLAERGLSAAMALPDTPERKQLELELQMMKGVALRSVTGWATPEIEQVFTRARQLCQELHDPPQLIPVLWATTLFLLIRGNLRECRDRADEMMAQAERSGEPAYLMAAHHVGGVVREFIGDMVESSRLLERCRELHRPSEHLKYVAMYGQDPGMTARAMSSRTLWALGRPDRALERARETLAIAKPQRQPLSLAFSLVVVQGIHLYRGEVASALAAGEEISALCREYALPQEALWSQAFQGYAMHLLGRTSEGIDVLKASLASQQAISAGLVRPAFLALLADALRHEGRTEEGLQAIEEGLAHAERTGEGGYVAELRRVRGELLLRAGNTAAAEAGIKEALEYAVGQRTKSFELRAAASLAELLLAAGRRDEARATLTPVYEWFTEGLETADLAGARTLLTRIG
jgi:predicted ATPase